MIEEPLIYTTLGNFPVAKLAYNVHWEETEEYIKLVETFSYQGEVVKLSAHVRMKEGLPLNAEQGEF